MYRCEFCNTVQPARTPCVVVTVQTRAAEYPSRPKAQRMRISRKGKSHDDPGGAGYEIARTKRGCPTCSSEFMRRRAEDEAAGRYDDEA